MSVILKNIIAPSGNGLALGKVGEQAGNSMFGKNGIGNSTENSARNSVGTTQFFDLFLQQNQGIKNIFDIENTSLEQTGLETTLIANINPEENFGNESVLITSPDVSKSEDASQEISSFVLPVEFQPQVSFESDLDIREEATLLSYSTETFDITTADGQEMPAEMLAQTSEKTSSAVFVEISKSGDFIFVDEAGEEISVPFTKTMQKNPHLREFLAQKTESNEVLQLDKNFVDKSIAEVVASLNDPAQNNIAENIVPQEQQVKQNISHNIVEDADLQVIAQNKNTSSPQNNIALQSNNSLGAQNNARTEMGMNFGNGENGNQQNNQNFANGLNKFSLISAEGEVSHAQQQNNTVQNNFSHHLVNNRPVIQQPVVDQVAMQLQKGLNGQIDKISIQLQPAHLGKVTISLDFSHDSQTKTIVIAEKSETLDMLRQDSRALQKILEDAGFETGQNSLEFSLDQNQAQQHDQNNDKQKVTDARFSIDGIENANINGVDSSSVHEDVITATKINIMV